MKAIILLIAIIPYSPVPEDRVSVAELNHFFDYNGRLIFDQVIYYDWSPHTERFQVRAWRLVKDQSFVPARDWEGGGYLSVWNDGEVIRRVRADSFRESWTQYDPELAEREVLCKERRRELRSVKP